MCFAVSGLRSSQQKALKLLEMMDPSIRQHLGTKAIETGDYKWREDMRPGLSEAITKRIDEWATKMHEPPFRYNPKKESDMALWKVRRQAGMLWVKSEPAADFAKHVYNVYADIFSALIKDQGQNQFVKVLESFFAKKEVHEKGDLRERLQKLLEPLCPICECAPSDVVDCLSFVTGIFRRAVFDFFGSQVRKTPNSKPATKRKKDREDKVSVTVYGSTPYVLQK